MKLTLNRVALLLPVLLTVAISGRARGAEATFGKTLQVSGGLDLEIETDSGSILVLPGSAGTVVIKGAMKTSRTWRGDGGAEEALRKLQANPPVRQSGNSIHVGSSIDSELQRHISISYEVHVPTETRLRSHSDSGGQTISGIRGPVDASADSGSIRISNIGGDARAQADSGRIEAEGIQGRLDAHADSGGIRARGVGGAIDVSADSGGIELQQTAAAPIRASCDSGGITVELANAGYDLSAKADNGGVNANVPITVSAKMKRNHVEGKVRGGGPQVILETDSGGIHIR